jgi:hypothetical protein
MYLGSTGKNGDPYFEILAPIYKEFQRWKVILQQEFQAYSLCDSSDS